MELTDIVCGEWRVMFGVLVFAKKIEIHKERNKILSGFSSLCIYVHDAFNGWFPVTVLSYENNKTKLSVR